MAQSNLASSAGMLDSPEMDATTRCCRPFRGGIPSSKPFPILMASSQCSHHQRVLFVAGRRGKAEHGQKLTGQARSAIGRRSTPPPSRPGFPAVGREGAAQLVWAGRRPPAFQARTRRARRGECMQGFPSAAVSWDILGMVPSGSPLSPPSVAIFFSWLAQARMQLASYPPRKYCVGTKKASELSEMVWLQTSRQEAGDQCGPPCRKTAGYSFIWYYWARGATRHG